MAGFAGTSISRLQWAELIVEENGDLGYKPMTPRQLAEGLGVREAEGDTAEGAHIGPWEEESSFGSTAARLGYRTSTRAALERWHADGKSWWPAWGNWEKGEVEGAGPERYKRHLALATAVLGRHALTGGRRRSPRSTTSSTAATSAGTPNPGGSATGPIGGDVLHFAVVALLVVGGVALIGLGVTRTFGPARRRA